MFNNLYQVRCLIVFLTVVNFVVSDPKGESLLDQIANALAQVFFFLLAMTATYRKDQQTPIRKSLIVSIMN